MMLKRHIDTFNVEKYANIQFERLAFCGCTTRHPVPRVESREGGCCAIVERFWFLLSGRSASDGITGHRRAWVKEDSFFCFVFLQKRKWLTVFYVKMDFGFSHPQWTLDPTMFSRREVGFGGIGRDRKCAKKNTGCPKKSAFSEFCLSHSALA